MADSQNLEKVEGGGSLSTEEVQRAIDLIKSEMRTIFGFWEQYKNARRINGGDTREFERPDGEPGAGLWEVDEIGAYDKYHFRMGDEEIVVVLQPGKRTLQQTKGPYEKTFISAWREIKKGDQVIRKDSPSDNSQEALDLSLELVKRANGGELPVNLSELSSQKA